MNYAEAIADVKARVASAHTSFNAGMNVLPKARREAMFALYAFSRAVDDIVDESSSADESRHGLQQWRARIAAVFNGKPSDSITTVLAPAIQAFNLVESDFQAIIDGMAMDIGPPICAPDMATLDSYCDRVASAVGRVSVRIFGDATTRAMDVAHYLGRALQLTNILRDLSEDAKRGRLYLPHELLIKHGLTSRVPVDVLRDPTLPAVCRDLAVVVRDAFNAADKAMKECRADAMRPAWIMRYYYGAIFDRLLEENWQHPATRVTLPKWRKIYLLIKGMAKTTWLAFHNQLIGPPSSRKALSVHR
jgi:presqualene diphosphate synthase